MNCVVASTMAFTGVLFTLTMILGITAPLSAQQTEPAAVTAAQSAPADDFKSAMHLYRQRRFAQAIESFQRITQSDPGNAAAWYFMGYAHYVTKHPAEALEAFHQAFQKDPAFDPRPYFRRSKG